MSQTAVADTAEKQSGVKSKYLTFLLGEEEYGLEILRVREINGLMDITAVPRLPGFVRGVINLRGKVIPVLDLRLKFGLESIDDTKETCVIVVDLGELFMGIVVDRVSEVLDIAQSDIEDTPAFGVNVDTEFILGMGKVQKRVVILLDIRKVLSVSDIEKLSKLEQ